MNQFRRMGSPIAEPPTDSPVARQKNVLGYLQSRDKRHTCKYDS